MSFLDGLKRLNEKVKRSSEEILLNDAVRGTGGTLSADQVALLSPEQQRSLRETAYDAVLRDIPSKTLAANYQMQQYNDALGRFKANPNTPLSQVDLMTLMGPKDFFAATVGGNQSSTLMRNAEYLSSLREKLRNETDPKRQVIIQTAIDDVVALGSVGKYNPELRGNVAAAIESAKTGTDTVLSPGQKSIDSAFATRYVKWEGGERQQADQNLKNLNAKLDILVSGDKNVSGPFLGQVPEGIRAFTNPDSLAFIGDIRDVVFQSLRATLGAQFTEREGDRLVAAAFDPRLSEAENYKRLKRLVEKIQDTKISMEAMSAHWSKKGTLQGYESSQMVFQDVFDSFVEEDFTGKSDEELRTLYDEGDITLQNSIINFLEKKEK